MPRANSDRPTAIAPRSTRDRLITATVEQFRHGGYHGTGIKSILTAAEAPYGSLYHFFPGGKEELAAAAVEASGRAYRDLVELYFPPGADPVEATRSFFDDAAEVLASTDWTDGCPLARVALETAQDSERLRQAALARLRVVAGRAGGAPGGGGRDRRGGPSAGRAAVLPDRGRLPAGPGGPRP